MVYSSHNLLVLSSGTAPLFYFGCLGYNFAQDSLPLSSGVEIRDATDGAHSPMPLSLQKVTWQASTLRNSVEQQNAQSLASETGNEFWMLLKQFETMSLNSTRFVSVDIRTAASCVLLHLFLVDSFGRKLLNLGRGLYFCVLLMTHLFCWVVLVRIYKYEWNGLKQTKKTNFVASISFHQNLKSKFPHLEGDVAIWSETVKCLWYVNHFVIWNI
jgi:hypothetical protein